MFIKKIIKLFIPPVFLSIRDRMRPFYGFWGDFPNWKVAEAELQKHKEFSKGYAEKNIIEQVNASIQKVRNGEAVFERDGVLFDKEDYNYPFLAALFWTMNDCTNKPLTVLDFGGSLGSTYFQNRKLLGDSVSWNIVEQPQFVEKGRKCVPEITFYSTIDEMEATGKRADILILSGVLQYFDNPYKYIDMFLQRDFQYLLIDRFYFNFMDRDHLSLQSVSPDIYPAVYPVWLMNRKKLQHIFESAGYKEEFSWKSLDRIPIKSLGETLYSEGFLMKKHTR